MTSTTSIDRFCHDLMVAIVNSGSVNEHNIDRAIEVMRAETKDFFFGENYADERATVLANSVHPGFVMASVVASCISKIRAAA